MATRDRFLFTSESVTEGHPDKIADQISDAILDACLEPRTPYSRVACETLTCTGLVVIAGEITTKAYVDFQTLVRSTVNGHRLQQRAAYGFDSNTCAVISTINKQSPDIAQGVDTGGAGDQGMMFGYATNETPELMPTAHLARAQALSRQALRGPQVRPPARTCARTARARSPSSTTDNNKPVRAWTQSSSRRSTTRRRRERPASRRRSSSTSSSAVIPAEAARRRTPSTTSIPTGRFVIGGPNGRLWPDRTQDHRRHLRRHGRHGGGAFSGKDATKVDRSAAYMARYVAKNIVAAGLADRCEVQLAYAIAWLSRSACSSTPSAPAPSSPRFWQSSSVQTST